MEQQDYILLIMNCKKYKHKALKQKNTWLKNIPSYIKYYHVIGDPNIENEYLLFESDKLLVLKVEDDYNSLPKKVICAYEIIDRLYKDKYKYIFKTDDDQLLTNPFFFNTIVGILNKREPKVNYGGFIVDVKKPYISDYYKVHKELPKNCIVQKTKYCSGRFYLLSPDSINHLLTQREKIEEEYFEDYSIGLYLTEELKENMLNISTNKYFIDME